VAVGRRKLSVMIVVLSSALLLAAATLPFEPHAVGWVKDEASVLDEAVEANLNGLLAGHEKATSNQVVVLTVPSLRGRHIELVSMERAAALKIGQEGRNNGVLLLVAPRERQVRIEVGYGLRHVLTNDSAAGIIRHEMLPRFVENDLEGGVDAGVRAILETIAGTYAPTWRMRLRDLVGRLYFLPRASGADQFLAGLVGSLAFYGIAVAFASIGWRGMSAFGYLASGVPAAVLALNYPIALAAYVIAAIGVILYRAQRAMRGGSPDDSSDDHSWSSAGGYSSSASTADSSSSSSSFDGGGGSFGGDGASGSWDN
jgi:uncharacterized protein